jgi:hypothetical protein
LARIWGVILYDQHVADTCSREACVERTQFGLVSALQRYGVGAGREIWDGRIAGSMDELGGLGSERNVGAD